MWLTNFKGIQEMGIICGGGLLVCFIPMMTLLPVLLLRGRQNVLDHKIHRRATGARASKISGCERPVMVAMIIVVLCALAVTQMRKVLFRLQFAEHAERGDCRRWSIEQKLIDRFGQVAACTAR